MEQFDIRTKFPRYRWKYDEAWELERDDPTAVELDYVVIECQRGEVSVMPNGLLHVIYNGVDKRVVEKLNKITNANLYVSGDGETIFHIPLKGARGVWRALKPYLNESESKKIKDRLNKNK